MGAVKSSVYDLKQAEQIDGKFLKGVSRVLDTSPFQDDYVKKYNEDFDSTGSFYEINKEADKEYQLLVKAKISKLKEAETEA